MTVDGYMYMYMNMRTCTYMYLLSLVREVGNAVERKVTAR